MSRLDSIEKVRNDLKNRGTDKYTYVKKAELENEGITQYKAEDGVNIIAIIPPKNPNIFYGRNLSLHRNIGADGRTVLCLADTFNEPCPICEEVARLKKIDKDDPTAKLMFKSRKTLYFVVDTYSKSGIDKGIRWFDCPITITNEIISRSQNKRTGAFIDISDPDNGKDVSFEKTGKDVNTKYIGIELEDREPIPEEWLDVPDDFEDFLIRHTYDELKEMLEGYREEDSSAEDEPPRRRRSFSKESTTERPARESRRSIPKEEPEDAVNDTPAEQEEKAEDIKGNLRRRRREE